MKDGFLKVATATPKLKVADTEYNANEIINKIKKAKEEKIKILVFPELAISSYTASDLFFQELLLKECEEALLKIKEATKGYKALIFVGTPILVSSKLYNAAAVFFDGEILAFITKENIPNYAEFYEKRWFNITGDEILIYKVGRSEVPVGSKILFQEEHFPSLRVGAEICEDLWVINPPSFSHAKAGATIIVNLSASNEIVGKDFWRKELVNSTSGRLISSYIYSDAGEGESTGDLVFTGVSIIAENGKTLLEKDYSYDEINCEVIDFQKLSLERRRTSTFTFDDEGYLIIPFSLDVEETELKNNYSRFPFVPEKSNERDERCSKILFLQSLALKKRLLHIGSPKAIIGLSGGLDSTLALLVTVEAFKELKRDLKDIIAITMPCFGTTGRTKNNAEMLAKKLGVTLKVIDIKESVLKHFKDIEQDENKFDVTFENAQARERTQVLMDTANKESGIVIGTGDLSELALGWATYNGDHMSMYGVNSGVPKTLIKYLVSYYSEKEENRQIKKILLDILDTPISPELLPSEEGKIKQETENIVGPYVLHDFYLYYLIRCGFSPKKVFRIASITFEGVYKKEELKKWLIVFIKRFFTQQYKRSCSPDGVKVGTLSLSPRGDWRMPSDSSYSVWIRDAEEIEV